MGTLSAAYSIWSSPRMTRDRVIDLQTRRLRALVAHTYATVPYYRNLYDRHGVRPESVRTLDDLTVLPITTKREMVASRSQDLLTRGAIAERLVRRRTSGSSGPSFTTYRSAAEELINELHQLRIRRSFGLRWSDVQVIAMMSDVRHAQVGSVSTGWHSGWASTRRIS